MTAPHQHPAPDRPAAAHSHAGMILPPETDDATAYAQAVVDGRAPAGPHVRNACKRHLMDLKHGPARGLRWDAEKAARAIGFFSDVLKLTGGEHEGRPFEPEPWQRFVLGSLFGWMGPDGYRRFRMAFIESGKGSGKSPLAAGVGLYMLVADNEPRAEVYAGASKKDQAMILFRDAVAMVKQSPALSQRLSFSGGPGREWNIAYLAQGSFFRPISSDDGASGPRPHCGILDEIHEHKDANIVEMLRAGTKGRTQALIFMITNSGVDRTSVCYQYHEYAASVCAGDLNDDSFFAYVCALDADDDPMISEDCWPKANPSLGVTIHHKYLREQVTQARGMPAKESIVRRLNFSQWTDAVSPWISGDLWRHCERDFDLSELEGLDLYGGLDLSGTSDLTSLALAGKGPDGITRAAVWFWTPAETAAERARRDRVPYDTWIRQGHLIGTPGRAVSYDFVAAFIAQLAARFEIKGIGYDPYRINYLIGNLDEYGVDVPLIPHGQGFFRSQQSTLWMPRSVDVLEKSVLDGTLHVQRNPVLTWNSASAVLETDPKGNRVFNKRKAAGRIDGVVALCMALGALDAPDDTGDIDAFLNSPIMVGL